MDIFDLIHQTATQPPPPTSDVFDQIHAERMGPPEARPAMGPPEAPPVYSLATLRMRGKNMERLVAYHEKQAKALDKEGAHLAVSPDGSLADPDEVTPAFAEKLKAHEAFTEGVNRQLNAYHNDVEAYNRAQEPMGPSRAAEQAPTYTPRFTGEELGHPGPPRPPLPTAPGEIGVAPLGSTTDVRRNPRTGLPMGAPSGPLAITDMPTRGVESIAQGVEQMAEPSPPTEASGRRNPRTGQVMKGAPLGVEQAGGLSKVIGGGFQVAAPLAAGSLVAAPVHTAVTLAAGIIADKGTSAGLKALGVAPEYADLAGNIAAMIAGYAAHAAQMSPQQRALVEILRGKEAPGPEAENVKAIKDIIDRESTDPNERLVAQRVLKNKFGVDYGGDLSARAPAPAPEPPATGPTPAPEPPSPGPEAVPAPPEPANLPATRPPIDYAALAAKVRSGAPDVIPPPGGPALPAPAAMPPSPESSPALSPPNQIAPQSLSAASPADPGTPSIQAAEPTPIQNAEVGDQGAMPPVAAVPPPPESEVIRPPSVDVAAGAQVPAGEPAPPAYPGEGTFSGAAGWVPPSWIELDPVTFQFKQEGIGQKGVTDQFKNTKEWDPDLAGTVHVWLNPADGKIYAVNGHHRVELAQRLGPDKVPEIQVRYIDAKDAVEARAKGAMVNIAEGNGTALDIAKFFRDSGTTPEELEAQGKIQLYKKNSQQGAALSHLAQPIFDQVVAGDLPIERAAIIGAGMPNHADQKVLMDVIDKMKKSGRKPSNAQIEEMIRLQRGGKPKIKVEDKQQRMFGDDEDAEDVSQSLLGEKAGISEYVRKQLSGEKKLFSLVGNAGAAARLGEAGNVINVGENASEAERMAQGMLVYDKLSASAGPVDDILQQAAQEWADGGKENDIKERAAKDIRAELQKWVARLAGKNPERNGVSEAVRGGWDGEGAPGQPPPSGEVGPQPVAGRLDAPAPLAGSRALPGDQPLFPPETEAELTAAAKHHADRLLGDRLTAQLRSGMAMRPANLKPASTRGLFEDSEPEQDSLFSRLPISTIINARDSVFHATDIDGAKGILESEKINVSAGHGGSDSSYLADMSAVLQKENPRLSNDQAIKLAEKRTGLKYNAAQDVGVSVSRVPRFSSKDTKAITFVIDQGKMPPSQPFVETGYQKTLAYPFPKPGSRNPRFEFENRTLNKDIPISSVKGIIIDRAALPESNLSPMSYSRWEGGWEVFDTKTGRTVATVPTQQTAHNLSNKTPGSDYVPDAKTPVIQEIQARAAAKGLPVKIMENGRDVHTYRAGLANTPEGQPLFGGRRPADPNQLSLFDSQSSAIDAPPAPRTTTFQFHAKGVRRLTDPPAPTDLSVESVRKYWSGAQSYAGHVGGVPAIFVNAPGMDIVLRKMGPTGRGQTSSWTGGLTLEPNAWQSVLSAPAAGDNGLGFNTAMAALQKSIGKARPRMGGQLIVLQVGPRITDEVLKRLAEEEYDHDQQMRLTGGLRGQPVEITHTDAGIKAAEALHRGGYPALNPMSPFDAHNRAVIAMEIGVRLMRPGRWRELNLTPQEAEDLGVAYVKGLEKHGEAASGIIGQVYAATKQGSTSQTSGRSGGAAEHAPSGKNPPSGGRGSTPQGTTEDHGVAGPAVSYPLPEVFLPNPRVPIIHPPRRGESRSIIAGKVPQEAHSL